MNSLTFFFFFIPILGVVFLIINFLLAPHNPYQEKYSIFECGFHSFLGQNRTQFSISFFLFALVFLIFDLELTFLFPFGLSGYVNNIYGFVFVLSFIVIITLGFVFELGKKALVIDSRQTIKSLNAEQSKVNNPFQS